MSIDALALVRSSPERARRSLVEIGSAQDDTGARFSVRAIGKEAALVSSPCRYPVADTAEEWRELVAFVRRLAKATSHDDPRGVLVTPDEFDGHARSYARIVELVGSEGHWVSLRGKKLPVRAASTRTNETRSRAATPPRKRPVATNTAFACMVFPPPAFRMDRLHPAFVEMTNLEDGTALVVVRELFSDADALHRFVFGEYPRLGVFATDPRGLLVLPGGSFRAARQATTYADLVAAYGPRGGWLER